MNLRAQDLRNGHALPLALQKGYRRRYALVLIGWALAALAVLTFIVGHSIGNCERQFADYGESVHSQLRDKLRANEAVLYGFASFLGAGGSSDPAALESYANSILERYPHIYSLELVRRVDADDLPRFVAAMRRAGDPGFSVRDYRVEESSAPEHTGSDALYPIVFVAPKSRHSAQLIGLDVGSRKAAREGLLLSEREGAAVSSESFRLLEGDLAYIMFRPVISAGKRAEDRGDARYALLVVRARDLAPLPASMLPNVHHRIILHGDRESEPLLDAAAEPAGAIATALLPRLEFRRELDGFSQPLRLVLDRQLRVDDLDLTALVLATTAAMLALALLFAYLRSHRQRQDEIEFLALHDSLTGLPNRYLLLGHLDKAVARAQRQQSRLALLFVDLDDFKPINDRFGHPLGDAVLKAVAERLRDCVRECDVAARYGGDEFVVLLGSVNEHHDAERVAAKILKSLAEPIFVSAERQLQISASIGIATFPEDGNSAEDLLDAADQAMYAAKLGGNGGFARCRDPLLTQPAALAAGAA